MWFRFLPPAVGPASVPSAASWRVSSAFDFRIQERFRRDWGGGGREAENNREKERKGVVTVSGIGGSRAALLRDNGIDTNIADSPGQSRERRYTGESA